MYELQILRFCLQNQVRNANESKLELHNLSASTKYDHLIDFSSLYLKMNQKD